MKIVKFKDGTYAIRKGFRLFGYKYRSINNTCWWPIEYLHYCKGSKDQITKLFNSLIEYGSVESK